MCTSLSDLVMSKNFCTIRLREQAIPRCELTIISLLGDLTEYNLSNYNIIIHERNIFFGYLLFK